MRRNDLQSKKVIISLNGQHSGPEVSQKNFDGMASYLTKSVFPDNVTHFNDQIR